MADWPRSDLKDLLGIEHPIFSSTDGERGDPGVDRHGRQCRGLGSLLVATFTPGQFRDQVGAVRADSKRLFNVSFSYLTYCFMKFSSNRCRH